MKIDANVIDRIVAKTIYGVEWWDYIGAEVSDDQWRLMMMGRLAGISEFANALKEVLNADRKTEPTISKMEQVDKDINVRSKERSE